MLSDKDKQKEEALILILKRKAELLRDIARVRKDVQENEKEISFFEDPGMVQTIYSLYF